MQNYDSEEMQSTNRETKQLLDLIQENQWWEVREVLNSNDIDVDSIFLDGKPMLYYAMCIAHAKQDTKILKVFLDNDASVKIKHKDGYSNWLHASSKGMENVVQYFCDHVSDLNVNEVSPHNETALMLAVKKERLPVVNILLNRKDIAVDVKDKFGYTPFMFAAFTLNIEIMNLLHAKGADVSAVDNSGKTALQTILQLVIQKRYDDYAASQPYKFEREAPANDEVILALAILGIEDATPAEHKEIENFLHMPEVCAAKILINKNVVNVINRLLELDIVVSEEDKKILKTVHGVSL